MRIGEMSRRTGVHARLLRYYEEQGLLTPERGSGSYRSYREEDVETVRRIRRLLAAGLSTASIALILPCVRTDGPRLVPVCEDTVAALRREHARVSGAIDELRASKEMLEHVIQAGAGPAAGTVDA
ncbi:MerR family transcriptional regulator [Streptacidiphilus fuscans]|uniref:MerR family transcriptional regulator n=1 Tax=Streptacidiphilus fuscans TaxID=2789292 RepID=A0A931AYY2_9ACTN|nr:MerR family transcriptional regulator [Streptacidiphilus fuscans]MBF9068009.1 MerR family transcriptional regulator [Streptacidiphilus fuscans]